MANQIVNAAPMVIEYGTQDLSKRTLPREPEAVPQHLPKFYLFTRKGPTEPQLSVGSERDQIYGSESFDLRSKYSNHSTVFSNLVNDQGNAAIIQRIIPEDAGPESNLIAWLDVLPTSVDLYERNDDGSIFLDELGSPVIDGTTDGFKVKWVITNHVSVEDIHNFGLLAATAGDQIDTETGVHSTRYPIFEIKNSSIGEHGNLSGIRLSAPTIKTVSAMPSKMMNSDKAYPYFISVIKKPDAKSSPKVVETLFGEQSIMVTFKENVIDPLTGNSLYVGETFIDSYQNLTDLKYPKLYGEFSDIHVYQDNIDELLSMFHAAEIPFIDSFSDFTDESEDAGLFNFITGVSSFNVPYHSFIFVDSSNSVRFSDYTNVYAAGGSDGTMTDAIHAALVKNAVEEYLDPNSPLQESAYNVESIIYDTGFPMETKLSLCSFIAIRKDTFLVLSTHDVNDRILTASEEHSIAVALRTRLQMYPESDYYGTPVMRGMIVGRSGRLRNSLYKKHLPVSAEIAIKSAKYMGASDGKWKNGQHFDGAPGSVIDYMYDINITWVPTSVRNRNWDVGLNWVQSYDRRSFFFPALKTIYSDDTSVLNSYFTALAIGQLNKINQSAWREYSGVSHLTNAQLVQRVNDFVTSKILNRFDNRFVIIPDAQITDMDEIRGFSWLLVTKIYSANMKTVMTSAIQANRLEDLQQ